MTDIDHSELTDDLIVVTYKRPAELESCLWSVVAQTHVPSSITIVEGKSPLAEGIPEDLREVLGDRLHYELSEPSLTLQRNIGIKLTSGWIVHFIDDDVVLEEDYFERILEVFSADKSGEIGGVGGLITNLPEHRSSWFKRFMLIDGPQGRFLPSGRNVLVFETDKVLDVDWLTGCSMSFRREVFKTEFFDEGHPRSLGFGDDVDLTTRVARQYRLVITPGARLEHRQSSIGRLKPAEIVAGDLGNRYQLAREKRAAARLRWFWFSVIGEVLILAGQSFRTLSLEPLRSAFYILRGLVSTLASRDSAGA